MKSFPLFQRYFPSVARRPAVPLVEFRLKKRENMRLARAPHFPLLVINDSRRVDQRPPNSQPDNQSKLSRQFRSTGIVNLLLRSLSAEPPARRINYLHRCTGTSSDESISCRRLLNMHQRNSFLTRQTHPPSAASTPHPPGRIDRHQVRDGRLSSTSLYFFYFYFA